MNQPPGGMTRGPRPANSRKNPDGSEIFFDSAGGIIATVDVLGERREFQVDPKSGRLMVKRFGLWTKPEQGRIDQHGSLYFRRGEMEILERLDGVHIQANHANGVTIKTDHKNKVELIELANGEVWKRQTTDYLEEFWIWRNSQPKFNSETYFKPVRHNAETPAGQQALSYVSRWEQSWENGKVVRQKFSFNNDVSNERHAPVALTLGRGMLMLRNVATVTTTFAEAAPKETVYTLAQATNLKIDIPVMKATFDKVTEVRCFAGNRGVIMAFRKADGTEQMINISES